MARMVRGGGWLQRCPGTDLGADSPLPESNRARRRPWPGSGQAQMWAPDPSSQLGPRSSRRCVLRPASRPVPRTPDCRTAEQAIGHARL